MIFMIIEKSVFTHFSKFKRQTATFDRKIVGKLLS